MITVIREANSPFKIISQAQSGPDGGLSASSRSPLVALAHALVPPLAENFLMMYDDDGG